jgi:pimeloyl-ACP methyl ester carboxylesterase
MMATRSLVHRMALVALIAASIPIAAQPAIRAARTASGIAYDVQGAGPAVVLISGSNLDRRMWAREAAWLAAAHTVIRYDFRAHGQSDMPAAPFNQVSDLWEVLDAAKIKTATLIGLSAGSAIALDAALANPDRVERIVLSGPAPSGYVPKERPPFFNDLMIALKSADYAKANEVILATPVFAAPPDSQALVRQMVTDNGRLWKVPISMLVPSPPALDRLEAVSVPTLVLIGEHDSLQRAPAELLVQRIPNARMVRVPGGGHLLNLTSPKEFEAAVRHFLR